MTAEIASRSLLRSLVVKTSGELCQRGRSRVQIQLGCVTTAGLGIHNC